MHCVLGGLFEGSMFPNSDPTSQILSLSSRAGGRCEPYGRRLVQGVDCQYVVWVRLGVPSSIGALRRYQWDASFALFAGTAAYLKMARLHLFLQDLLEDLYQSLAMGWFSLTLTQFIKNIVTESAVNRAGAR